MVKLWKTAVPQRNGETNVATEFSRTLVRHCESGALPKQWKQLLEFNTISTRNLQTSVNIRRLWTKETDPVGYPVNWWQAKRGRRFGWKQKNDSSSTCSGCVFGILSIQPDPTRLSTAFSDFFKSTHHSNQPGFHRHF